MDPPNTNKMYAVSTYDEIVKNESRIENNEIVVFLFARSTETEIIKDFEYIHFNSGKYCSVYAVGYTNNPDIYEKDNSYHKVQQDIMGYNWFFSNKAYVEFKSQLEKEIGWVYSGEVEIIILQNNPGSAKPLDFRNYVAINIDKGIREKYIDSFQSFMEALIRISKSKVSTDGVVAGLRKSRISLKDIISGAIADNKAIPQPVKKILQDRLFYRPFGKKYIG